MIFVRKCPKAGHQQTLQTDTGTNKGQRKTEIEKRRRNEDETRKESGKDESVKQQL